VRRGYAFDATKIAVPSGAEVLVATRGQLDYEWAHLQAKLQVRAPAWLAGLGLDARPQSHPLFRIVAGPVAAWEVVQPKPSPRRAQGRRTISSN